MQVVIYSQSQDQILFNNVKLFDGKSTELSSPVNVLIEGNKIKQISSDAIQSITKTQVINGNGKTLMPGLIDVHVHLVFGSMTMNDLMSPNLSEEFIIKQASINAEKMLMRGFTAVRDVGGPIFQLKAGIDAGKIIGPRV